MGDNGEQEAADLDAMIDDVDDTLLVVIYPGYRLVNIPNVPFRLIIHKRGAFDNSRMMRRMLREVVFHNNVTIIGRFQYFVFLRHVELPSGLLRVKREAFINCTSLREIMIPASVQYMGDAVFEGCQSLQTVVFVPTPNMVELGSGMFRGCSNLQSVILPHNLQSIPAYFFYGCTSLVRLRIPKSVEEIGEEALYGSSIQSIDVPEQVHSIRWAAFKNCTFLERVTIHSTNLTMNNNIFVNCPALSMIEMYPLLWPTLFASMNEHPDFIIKFFQQYHTQIFNFQTPPTDVRAFSGFFDDDEGTDDDDWRLVTRRDRRR